MKDLVTAPPLETIHALFDAQIGRRAERRASFGLAERRAALKKLRAAIRKFQPDLVAALAQDFAKPEAEVQLTEILPVTQEISHTLRHLRKWMRPKRPGPGLATLGTSARVMPQARGVCLIIAPWNYPFNLCLGPLVSCLAAGNSAILKPSEMTPATSALIARLIADTFPPDLVTVVEGGIDASQALLDLPFDHVFFTGSPGVGKIVMGAAAKHLASVTLELGGKSPTIITEGADLKKAAIWVAFGKFANAGQTCIAPDHVYVQESVKAEFLKELRARIAKSYGSGPTSPHLAQIVNERHAGRLRGLLADALEKGATLISGGGGEGTKLPPTLIEALTPEMEIDSEEIFGPILPILPYHDLDAVLAEINAKPNPLSLYIFDKDQARIDKILAGTISGGVGINMTVMHYIHGGLPFGGAGYSGIGAAHGEYGFRTFSHERAVLRDHFSAMPLIFPPYEGRAAFLGKLVNRILG